MSWIFAIQLFVPQILTVWLALVPARIRLGFVVQVIGSVAVLAVFTLQGIWLVPPWWAPSRSPSRWALQPMWGGGVLDLSRSVFPTVGAGGPS